MATLSLPNYLGILLRPFTMILGTNDGLSGAFLRYLTSSPNVFAVAGFFIVRSSRGLRFDGHQIKGGNVRPFGVLDVVL